MHDELLALSIQFVSQMVASLQSPVFDRRMGHRLVSGKRCGSDRRLGGLVREALRLSLRLVLLGAYHGVFVGSRPRSCCCGGLRGRLGARGGGGRGDGEGEGDGGGGELTKSESSVDAAFFVAGAAFVPFRRSFRCFFRAAERGGGDDEASEVDEEEEEDLRRLRVRLRRVGAGAGRSGSEEDEECVGVSDSSSVVVFSVVDVEISSVMTVLGKSVAGRGGKCCEVPLARRRMPRGRSPVGAGVRCARRAAVSALSQPRCGAARPKVGFLATT